MEITGCGYYRRIRPRVFRGLFIIDKVPGSCYLLAKFAHALFANVAQDNLGPQSAGIPGMATANRTTTNNEYFHRGKSCGVQDNEAFSAVITLACCSSVRS